MRVRKELVLAWLVFGTACGKKDSTEGAEESAASATAVQPQVQPETVEAKSKGTVGSAKVEDHEESAKEEATTPLIREVLGFVPSNRKAEDKFLMPRRDSTIAGPCEIDTSGRGSCVGLEAERDVIELEDENLTKVAVFYVRNLTIEANGVLRFTGPYPAMILSAGEVRIAGRLSVDAKGRRAGAGGFESSDQEAPGRGPGAGHGGEKNGHGASGGSYCGKGGAGAGAPTDLPTGATYGTTSLVPLLPGSSGGNSRFRGGAGGGAIQIVARDRIAVLPTASISASGGGAGSGGAGGGSGGAILLEAPKVLARGQLAANGGEGTSQSYVDGKDGNTDSPTVTSEEDQKRYGRGGLGARGETIDGEAGTSPVKGRGHGAGGGGAGFIRINTESGEAELGDRISPAVGTACVSIGKITIDAR